MGVRRLRILFAVAAIYLLGSWYYRSWGPYVGSTLGSGLDSELYQVGKPIGQIRWKKLKTRYPVETLAKLPKVDPAVKIPKVQAAKPAETSAARKLRLQRLEAVKNSFQHSWGGYKQFAWLKDEVMPLSGSSKDPFGGWAATLVDALDTLWIMGLHDDFARAAAACDGIDFATTRARDINVFETTIRYLGGFLAAYELSERRYPNLLKKAVEVGELLMAAFDTPNRMPVSRWPWREYVRGEAQVAPSSTLISEIGSLNMEFTKLSQLTSDLSFYDAAQRITDQFEKGQASTGLPGMWPVVVDASKDQLEFKGDTYTLGGMADSLYEYFPKQYLVLGGASSQPRKMYEGFIEVAKKHLFRRALNPGNIPITFSGDVKVQTGDLSKEKLTMEPRAQHLTCFAGGMVGLAAKVFSRPADMELATQLTDGCVWSYHATNSGIGPEIFHFAPCDPDPAAKDDCRWSEARWKRAVGRHYKPKGEEATDEQTQAMIDGHRLPPGMTEVNDKRYILRPEAIESVFLMYRMTGDAAWMDKAWDMFSAIERHSHAKVAAASLDDVTKETPKQVDSMESFWLAETLKYFYLVFSDWDVVDLDKWVLNTEAHPLRRGDAMQ